MLVAIPIEDFEGLMETLDVLADSAVVTAIQSARNGKLSVALAKGTGDIKGL